VAYFYDAYTFPEARGQGLMSGLLKGSVSVFEGSSVRRCEAWIERANRASIRAFEKAGFRAYGSWCLVAVGPLRLVRGAPRIGPYGE